MRRPGGYWYLFDDDAYPTPYDLPIGLKSMYIPLVNKLNLYFRLLYSYTRETTMPKFIKSFAVLKRIGTE